MAVRLQRQCKPETSVKNSIVNAIRLIAMPEIKVGETYVFRVTLPDEIIMVELWGGSRFCKATAVFNSTRRGQWLANLNGYSNMLVGKPWQRLTGAEVAVYVAEKGALPVRHDRNLVRELCDHVPKL